MNSYFVNEEELRKAIQVLKPNEELFEVRIIGSQKPISGYFKDADTLIKAFSNVDLRDTNIYITLNQVNDACFSRQQSERFMKGKNSTQDTEIDGYKFLFIDLDPIRPTGISSTKEEYKAACDTANKVCAYLDELGFEKPIKAVSGNGAHILYRINLSNTEENRNLIRRCLNALATFFDNDVVTVDTSNFNPSRVCKLYGTLAQKGKNTEERPHRMSKIVDVPSDLRTVGKVYLEKLANEFKEEKKPAPAKYNNYNPSEFDIEEWMNEYGLRYKEVSWRDGCKKYVLESCPFNHNHKSPDSMILKQASGAIGFKCLHNSCQCYSWRDVRLMYEPDAYDDKREETDRRIEEGWKIHNNQKSKEEVTYRIEEVETDNEPMFQNLTMILNKPAKNEEYIKTGINVIDKKMKGLQKGAISVVSGLRGSAKSTILSEITLNAAENGQTTLFYSGELSDQNFAKWMFLQAAGKSQVVKSNVYENFFIIENENVKKNIADWMGDKLWLYNNRYGNDFMKISTRLQSEIEKRKADLVILDNLMALNLESLSPDKYEAQTKFVNQLKTIAEVCNVHIIFVAHPRKAMGFLRLDDVAGSGNLTNYVDNAFIVHRNNSDFKRLSKVMFGWKDDAYVYSGTNVIEICKDRENGNQDVFIPLWYEPETKRLKNTPDENVVYSWNEGFREVESTPFDDI